MKYSIFEEVESEGQEKITSRWLITQKDMAYRQKKI